MSLNISKRTYDRCPYENSNQSIQRLRCPHEETASSAIQYVHSEDSDRIAQADLNLRWVHRNEGTFFCCFFDAAAHKSYDNNIL